MLKWLLWSSLVVGSGTAVAHPVVKCALPDGRVAYRDTPCPVGVAAAGVNTRGNVIDASHYRAAIAAEQQNEAAAALRTAQPILIASPAREIDEMACRSAQRNVEMAYINLRSELSRNKHGHAERSAVKVAEIKAASACGTPMPPLPVAPAAPVAQPNPGAPPSLPSATTMSCANGHCVDNRGGTYRTEGPNRVSRPDGSHCSVSNGWVHC